MGEIIVNFLGPPPNAFLERKALDILGTYLTSSAVAPLNKEFIEIESPLWSVSNLCCAVISDTRYYFQFLYLFQRRHTCNSCESADLHWLGSGRAPRHI